VTTNFQTLWNYRLRRIGPRLCGTEVRSDVALMYDFQSRWMLESGFSNPSTPWLGPKDLYLKHANMLYRILRECGVNVDVASRGSDLTRYRMIVMSMMPLVDDVLAGRLRDFVSSGGTLVWHPYSGMCDEHLRVYPHRLHPLLEELFGVDAADFAALRPQETWSFEWGGAQYAGTLFADLLALQGASATAAYSAGWPRGRPAVVTRREGKGNAIYVGTFADAPFYRAFLYDCMAEAGVRPIMAGTLPDGIEVACRTAADGRRLIILINRAQQPGRVPLERPATDLWADERVAHEVIVAAGGVRVLEETAA
jgi:beta-galactosidase